MNKILLDINAYVALKSGNTEVLAILQQADVVGINIIVLGELTAGFLIGLKYKKNITELNEFLSTPRISIFSLDEATISFYAKIYATLR